MIRSLWIAGFWLVCGCVQATAMGARPNVLLILVDDLAAVGSAFGGSVETPALDALAAGGYRFTHNYANVPVCGASRASMLGGLAPTADRFLTYNSRLDSDAPDVMSLPALFKRHGWHTLANGKVFDVIADSADGWSEPVWNPDNQWHSKQDEDERGEHLQKGYLQPVEGARPPYAERLEVADDAYPDGQIALKSADDLARLAGADTPFFMAVGFRKPHLPFNAPARYWTDDPAAISLPPSWHDTSGAIPDAAKHLSFELRMQYDALPLFGDPDTARAKEIIAAYRAATRYADAQVAILLRALADNGLADNTIVVLSGDHGFLLGQHRMWTKHALLEPALRTPLIIRAPGYAGGTAIAAVSDLLDVYPTLADLAGLPRPDHLDGASLVPLLDNPALAARSDKTVSIARWGNGTAVRDAQYRYARWYNEQDATLAQVLFDLRADPDEMHNLAADPASAATVTRMRALLQEYGHAPHWSDAMGNSVAVMSLMGSRWGTVLLLATVYPVQALATALLAIAFIAWGIRRWVRSRRLRSSA